MAPGEDLTESVTNRSTPLSEATQDGVRAALASLGLELCHVDWRPGARRGVLTLTIDRPGGVTLEDCEAASRAASDLLEAADPIPGAWVLEVCSPGLDRPLWSLDDARRFVGRRVRVTTTAPVDGARHMKGLLEGVEGGALVVVDEDRRHRYTVQFGDVKVARLVPEFEAPPTPSSPARRERPAR